MKLIGITGDSGVGKSTLALRLSEKLKCPFLDIDSYLERPRIWSRTNLELTK